MEHELKTWPHAFDAIREGRKTFEVRSNRDRDFAEGDTLVLLKWDPAKSYANTSSTLGSYIHKSGFTVSRSIEADTLRMRVTYVLHGGRFGLPDGLCVMAIVPAEAAP